MAEEEDKPLRISASRLDLSTEPVDSEGKIAQPPPFVNYVTLWDTLNNRVAGNRVKEEVLLAEVFPGANADASQDVPVGERWEILQIDVMLLAEVFVADRVLTLSISQSLDTLATTIFAPTALTASSGQLVGYVMSAGFAPNLMTHDNGVTAIVADENPLPIRLQAGSGIDAIYTNKQATDLVEMLVWYRKV